MTAALPRRGPLFGLSRSVASGAAWTETISSDLRLCLYAVGRADTFGHAEFRPGELAERLGVQPGAVRKLIAKLKQAGLVAREANARCVLPAWEIRGGGHRPDDLLRCGEHGPMGAVTARRVPPMVLDSRQKGRIWPSSCGQATLAPSRP
ncbi:MarR family transcriptional regulator [Streptomyces katsurahamanus]|uniref:MarR family transcriptional regulator n=1 Tax=Streptomyces katsurahamanus TaxID=2577098 RepID=A0ABW9NZ70_9ACTN|nr:MarR family transcriptional regulator [Streptomyces katsurahamanus]